MSSYREIDLHKCCYFKFTTYEDGTQYFVLRHGTYIEHEGNEHGMSVCGAIGSYNSYSIAFNVPKTMDYGHTFYYNQKWEFHDGSNYFKVENKENHHASRGEIYHQFIQNIGKINMYLENKYMKEAIDDLA
jgi:hypothetical protein